MAEESESIPSDELQAAEAATRAAAAGAERWLEHHRRVASQAVSEPQIDALLREALARVARLLDADAVSLLLANEEETALVSRAALGLSRELDQDLAIPRGAGASGPVLATGQPRFIEDLTQVEVVSEVLRSSGLRSYVGVPLKDGERTFGVLHATRRRVAPFGPHDAELLNRFAEPLAAAIARVRLFDAERAARRVAEEATAAARRATERVQSLQRITAALASAASTAEICGIIVNQTVPGPALEGERAIWTREGDRLVLVAGAGRSGAYPEVPLDASLPAAEILERGEPMFVESPAEMARRWPALAGGGTISFAGLPLIVGGRRLGLMAVGYTEEHRFEPDEREYLLAIAEQAALALSRAEAQRALEEARWEAESRREQLDFLAEASERFGRSLDLDVTLRTVADLAVPRLTDRCALYLLDGSKIDKQVIGPPLSEDESTLFDATGTSVSGPGIGEVIRSGSSQYIRDTLDSELESAARSPEHLLLLQRVGFGGILVEPLRARGQTLGALAFVNRRGRPMDTDTVALATEMTARAAIAIDNAQMYARQSHVAHQLVDSLLPTRVPDVAGLDIAVHYEPVAKGLEIGGDFYDVIPIDERSCLVVIGDVQGKGVEAAAITGLARNTIRAGARFEASPVVLLHHLNASLIENIIERAEGAAYPWDNARLCTAAIVRLDRRRRGWRARVASAGHPLPLLRRAAGSVETVGTPGLMLGVEPDPTHTQSTVDLEAGDAIVLFTDGISDCEVDGRPFGSEGIAAVLEGSDGGAAALTAAVAAEARRDPEARDDAVILTVRVRPR